MSSTTPASAAEEATTPPLREQLAVAGTGTIACGLAVTAAQHGNVVQLARSQESAQRARASIDKLASRLGGDEIAQRVEIVTDPEELSHATFVVEAIIEHHAAKADLLGVLNARLSDEAVLATTTSSLSVEKLAAASGRPDRFAGLHVFNPVPRMKLVELVFPSEATEATRARAHGLALALGKTPVELPDTPGFVVNRLLFPFLFSAVRLVEETGVDPADVDRCMTLGAGHPMGPLALLDLVGLDVAEAIGEAIGEPVPERIYELISEGALGRKTGRGLLTY